MSEIVDIRAFEVMDSRGNPTVMAEVTLDDDTVGVAYAPSGASTILKEVFSILSSFMNNFTLTNTMVII